MPLPENYKLFAQEVADAQRTPATKPDPKDTFKSPDFWITVGLLLGGLIIAGTILSFVDRWRKKNRDLKRQAAESLTDFRELMEDGDITHSEYERIRNKMAGEIKEKVMGSPKPKLPTLPPVSPGNQETPPGQ